MPHRTISLKYFPSLVLALLMALPIAAWAEPQTAPEKSVFLVATNHLDGTGFQETVILLTHFGPGGSATGLALNRPTDIPLGQAFPGIEQLREMSEPLYMGGPVNTRGIFVLLRTQQPQRGMMHVVEDVYLLAGDHAFNQPLVGKMRTFAGYAGWAPGQLQGEIDRGDWQVVREDPALIFDGDTASLWQRLVKAWSGDWI